MFGIITFLTVSIIIFNSVALLIPKNLAKIEIYASIIVVIALEFFCDLIFGVKYEVYGYFYKGVDLQSFIVILGLFPSANIIMMNYYPFSKGSKDQALYLVLVTCGCLVYEWLSLKSGWFYYTTWKLWYSAVCYPIMIFVLSRNVLIVRRLVKKE